MGDFGKKIGRAYGTVTGFALGGPAGAKVGGDIGGGKSAKKAFGGLTGKTEQVNTIPPDILQLRSSLANFLMQGLQGYGNEAFGFGQGSEGFKSQLGVPPESVLAPYRNLFAQNRGAALAQAKEAAGNLTGSGYNNILGSSLGQSLAQEDVTLANLGLQQQQFRQNQQEQFLRLLLGLSTTGVGPQGQAYTPGFLDYLFQGASAAAPLIAGGRASNAGVASPVLSTPVPNPYIPNITVPGYPY